MENYYNKINSQQLKSNISLGKLSTDNGQTTINNAINALDNIQRTENDKQYKDATLQEYYNKEAEKHKLKVEKTNTLALTAAFNKDKEALNAKYTDLTDPVNREEYKKNLQELYEKRNLAYTEKVNKDTGYLASVQTQEEFKKVYAEKLKNDTISKLSETFSNRSMLSPEKAWESVNNVYNNIIKTAKTPEDKLAIMNAKLAFEKTTNADDIANSLESTQATHNLQLQYKAEAETKLKDKIKNSTNNALQYLQNISFNGLDKNSGEVIDETHKNTLLLKAAKDVAQGKLDVDAYNQLLKFINVKKSTKLTPQQKAQQAVEAANKIDTPEVTLSKSKIEIIQKSNKYKESILKANKLFQPMYNAIGVGENPNIYQVWQTLPDIVKKDLKKYVNVIDDGTGTDNVYIKKNKDDDFFSTLYNYKEAITSNPIKNQSYNIDSKLTAKHFILNSKDKVFDSKFIDPKIKDITKYALHKKFLSKNIQHLLPEPEKLKKLSPGYYKYLMTNKNAYKEYENRRKIVGLTEGLKATLNTASDKNIRIIPDYNNGFIKVKFPNHSKGALNILEKLPETSAIMTSGVMDTFRKSYQEKIKQLKNLSKGDAKLTHFFRELHKKFKFNPTNNGVKINAYTIADMIEYIADYNIKDD